MTPVFWLVGGDGVTLDNLTITGINPGGYVTAGAFEAGVRSDGVVHLNVSNVTVEGVYGDGVELTALRFDGDIGSQIIRPTEDATIENVAVDGSGRQGMSLVSVNNATLVGVTLRHVGINAFDVEADQWNEGATNVTVDGCTVGGGIGGLFFANGGASGGQSWTGNITVENCTMTGAAAGEAILVQAADGVPRPRGPFAFLNDNLGCGSSVYVACVESKNANVTINGSSLSMPAFTTIHEPVYRATANSNLSFGNDSVKGYGSLGQADPSSRVTVTGGSWTAFGAPRPSVPAAVPPTGPAGVPAQGMPQAAPAQPATTSTLQSPAVPSTTLPRVSHEPGRIGIRPSLQPVVYATGVPQPRSSGEVGLATLWLGCLALLFGRRRGRGRRVSQGPPPSTDDLLGLTA
jgi:hypothetical protein